MARKKYGFWIDVAQAEGLKAVKVRDGIPESEQVRRAIADWLARKRMTDPQGQRGAAAYPDRPADSGGLVARNSRTRRRGRR